MHTVTRWRENPQLVGGEGDARRGLLLPPRGCFSRHLVLDASAGASS
jgi:hypothetical protein